MQQPNLVQMEQRFRGTKPMRLIYPALFMLYEHMHPRRTSLWAKPKLHICSWICQITQPTVPFQLLWRQVGHILERGTKIVHGIKIWPHRLCLCFLFHLQVHKSKWWIKLCWMLALHPRRTFDKKKSLSKTRFWAIDPRTSAEGARVHRRQKTSTVDASLALKEQRG